MSFNHEKLNIIFKNSYNKNGTFENRRYSLSHSDDTGDLFLTIGNQFYYNDNQTVLAELLKVANGYYLQVYVYLDGNNGIADTVKRDKIFRRELTTAIQAIIYGDREFLIQNELLDSYVVIRFKSHYSKYNVEEQWGKVKKYLFNNS